MSYPLSIWRGAEDFLIKEKDEVRLTSERVRYLPRGNPE